MMELLIMLVFAVLGIGIIADTLKNSLSSNSEMYYYCSIAQLLFSAGLLLLSLIFPFAISDLLRGSSGIYLELIFATLIFFAACFFATCIKKYIFFKKILIWFFIFFIFF